MNGEQGNKKSFLTDATGKPSDTRLKSWICFVISFGVMIVDMIGKGGDNAIMYFIILFIGGASWQLLGKVLETVASKKI